MPTPLEIANSRRQPVVYRGAPAAPRRAPTPTRRRQPPRGAVNAPRQVDWGEVERKAMSTPSAQRKAQQQAEEAAPEQEGFWGSDFGKGLGFLINNPVTRGVTTPLNYLQTGGRAMTLGLEELAGTLPGAPPIVQSLVANMPGAGWLLSSVDKERTEADTRSNAAKVFAPNSTYGFGELTWEPGPDAPGWQQWANRARGLAGDIALDPLTYAGGAATRAAAGASHVDRAARGLDVAADAFRLANEGSDAAKITRAETALDAAARYANEAPEIPNWRFETPMPRTRAERANWVGQLVLDPKTRPLVEQFQDDLARGAERGFQVMSPEAKAAFNISEPGMRLRGFNTKLPGTGRPADLLNRGGGAVRAGINKLPYADSKARNIRVPKDLEESYGIVTAGHEGDFTLAAQDIGLRNEIRIGKGALTGRENRVLSSWVRKDLKGKSKSQIRKMVHEAETTPDMNPVNTLFKRIVDTYQQSTGRVLNPDYMRDPARYFPHKLDPKFRRVLLNAQKKNRGSAAADFMRESGFVTDDLLEGSGFLEKSRKLQPVWNEKTQQFDPLEIEIGGRKVVIDDGTVKGLNENQSLRAAFPGYKGNFYDDDPVRVAESYVGSLSRQAGRDRAEAAVEASGTSRVRRLTGDLEATRQEINTTSAQQGPARILATGQGTYDPAQPLPAIPDEVVVPGSAVDVQRRKTIEDLLSQAQAANDPIEAAARHAEAAASPAPAQRFGDIDPNEFFVRTEGTEATAEQAKQVRRARTYARAASANVSSAEPALREAIGDIRSPMAEGLRGTIKQQSEQITAFNKVLRKIGKTLTEFGPLTQDNINDLEMLHNKIVTEIQSSELALRRKASSWKGRSTKAQKKVEAELRDSLAQQRQLLDDLNDIVVSAPKRMRDEWEFRTKKLNQPVEDAQKALLAKEVSVGAPPHNQAAVEAAEQLVPQMQKDYDAALAEITKINGKPRLKNGKLSAEDQRALDAAVARRKQIERLRQEAIDRAGEPIDPAKPRAMPRAYDTAQAELAEVNEKIAALEAGTPPPAAVVEEAPPAVIEPPTSPIERRPVVLDKKHKLSDGSNTYSVTDGADDYTVRKNDDNQWIVRTHGQTTKADNGYRTLKQAEDAINEGKHRAPDVPTPTPTPVAAAPAPATAATEAAELAKLQARRQTLERQFKGTGRYAAEARARKVLADMAEYKARLEAATGAERAALEQAQEFRALRQEAMIFSRSGMGGQRLFGEDVGWGLGERRHPMPIEDPPQGAAFAQQWWDEGATQPKPVPQPRTEAEALTSLRGQVEYGNQRAQGHRAQQQAQARKVAGEEATIEPRVNRAKTTVMKKYAADADAELNPMATRVKTYTRLADDVSSKKSVVIKRDELKGLRERLRRADPKYRKLDLFQTIDEIEAVARANPLIDDQQMTVIESLLQSHRAELQRINDTKVRVADIDRVATDAKNGRLRKVMIASLNDNWKALHEGPLQTGDLIIDTELKRRLENLYELTKDSVLMGRVWNAATDLFKTYATLSPGFHIRNTIGGIFMNTTDGVSLTHQLEGFTKFREFLKADEQWLNTQPQRIRDAFDAAMTSGAGGRFEDVGVAARTNSKIYNFLSSNKVLRWSQRQGTKVEGGMRLGMALASIDDGMSVQQAVDRISRVHFDYSQISQADDVMKRIIPFWTFMSRNLPLQIQQQWTNPRVYSYYNNLVNNFSEDPDQYTPEYWTRQGAWKTPLSIGGNPIYAQPDLGFTRVEQDIKMLGNLVTGDAGTFLSQTNPIGAASYDFGTKQDSFYGRQFSDTDYTKRDGLLGWLMTQSGRPFGQVNEAGQVSDNWVNYMTSLVPPINQANRLIPSSTGSDAPGWDTAGKWARYLGAPTQLLTPQQQERAMRDQYFKMLDEAKRQQAMARESAS